MGIRDSNRLDGIGGSNLGEYKAPSIPTGATPNSPNNYNVPKPQPIKAPSANPLPYAEPTLNIKPRQLDLAQPLKPLTPKTPKTLSFAPSPTAQRVPTRSNPRTQTIAQKRTNLALQRRNQLQQREQRRQQRERILDSPFANPTSLFQDFLDSNYPSIIAPAPPLGSNLQSGVEYFVYWDGEYVNGGLWSRVVNGGQEERFGVTGSFNIGRVSPYGQPDGRAVAWNSPTMQGDSFVSLGSGQVVIEIPPPYNRSGLGLNYLKAGTWHITRIVQYSNNQPVPAPAPIIASPLPNVAPEIIIESFKGFPDIQPATPQNNKSPNPLPTDKHSPDVNPFPYVNDNGTLNEPQKTHEGLKDAENLQNALDEMQKTLDKILENTNEQAGENALRNDILRAANQRQAQREAERQLSEDVATQTTSSNPNPNPSPSPNASPNPANPALNPLTGQQRDTATTGSSPTTTSNPSPNPLTNLLPLLGATAVAGSVVSGLSPDTPLNPTANLNPTPTTPNDKCRDSTDPTAKCLNQIEQKLDQQGASRGIDANRLAQLLALLQTFLQGLDLTLLTTINNKLGSQLPGGLSGFLLDKFAKLWKSRVVDRALNLMATAAAIHNAVMLSRNIGGTLVQVLANSLTIIGIKDADEVSQNFSEVIGSSIENVIKGLIGASNYTQLTETWKKANRIYQAATNIYQLMTDSLWGIKEGIELTAKYTGKVGNALKKSGTVLENAYDWMSETFNFSTSKNRGIQRVIEGLGQANEVADDLENITGEFRNARENIEQITTDVTTIKTEVQGKETTKTTTETTGKNNSQSPAIPTNSMERP